MKRMRRRREARKGGQRLYRAQKSNATLILLWVSRIGVHSLKVLQ
jgi:hypothetical protein